MNKVDLLSELNNHTYVMLQPSPISGIGVFALQNIPVGCREMFSKPNVNDEWITLSKNEVDELPSHSKFLVGNYCLYDDDENYFVPAEGFKKIDLSLFINHSITPNIISINDGDYFEAIKNIEIGEELVLDYGQIV
jgi:SET domain-containing protein